MDKIMDLMNNLGNLEKFIPKLDSLMGLVQWLISLAVRVGPVCILVLGLFYLFIPPKEANRTAGYRTYFGMGSILAWRFTQRLAGIVWGLLGLVLTLVMFSLTGKFAEGEISQILDLSARYLIWEGVLAAVSCVVINTIVMIRFTYSGDRRKDRVGK